MSAAGTTGLIESGKEQARWHLDELRYRTDKSRSRVDRWLAVVFGFVGAAGLADLVIQPGPTDALSARLTSNVLGGCAAENRDADFVEHRD